MNKELTDKAIDVASTCISLANHQAEYAEMARLASAELLPEEAGEKFSIEDYKSFNVGLLTAISTQLNEISHLLRAIIAHTGAMIAPEGGPVDLFAAAVDAADEETPVRLGSSLTEPVDV